MKWHCGIGECTVQFNDPEDLIVHQTEDHNRIECQVCGTILPDGYLAIRHAVEGHTRAEYMRSYGVSVEAVRTREQIKDEIESHADLTAVIDRLDGVTLADSD